MMSAEPIRILVSTTDQTEALASLESPSDCMRLGPRNLYLNKFSGWPWYSTFWGSLICTKAIRHLMQVKVPIALNIMARIVGWPLTPFSLVCPPGQRSRKLGVLFPKSCTCHETEFSPMRYMWRSPESLGKIFLFWSEKSTWRQTPWLCQLSFLTLKAVCEDLMVAVLQPSCNQEENVKRTTKLLVESSSISETRSHISIALTENSNYISTSISIIKAIILPRSFASTITTSNYYIIK